jgi:hypothetical protein
MLGYPRTKFLGMKEKRGFQEQLICRFQVSAFSIPSKSTKNHSYTFLVSVFDYKLLHTLYQVRLNHEANLCRSELLHK